MAKYFRFVVVIAIAILMSLSLAQAEAPKVNTQVPGWYRLQLGQFEVTALYDGGTELPTKLLKNVTQTELNHLLSRMFVGNPMMKTSVNAYLVNTGSHLVLIDAGATKAFSPSLGNVVLNMKAAGYDPAQVDMVLITHMHPDHMGGLVDASGQPVFTKAQILVSQLDSNFWLSQKVADGAPTEAKPFFKIARDSAAPYQKSGQWKSFTEGSVPVPGIRAVKANGHTPGHTAYAVESEGQKLLIWGDLMHAHAAQFPKPGVSIEFDTDQKQAIATRRGIMKSVAASKSLVAGMHLPFPGIGHVRTEGKSSYRWIPIEYGPLSSSK
jgi:glyoxylase-like metal-dependent hydrolase (beta-lactamase superfamily II)